MSKLFKSLPFWVCLAFACLLVAWSAIITVASKNKVAEVPLQHSTP